MSFSILLSMSAFALASSISPGPVNLVGLSSGIRYPLRYGFIFISGATLGFLLLFILVGLGLNQLFIVYPETYQWLHWTGVIFLIYLSWMLFRASGDLSESDHHFPGFWSGFLMQWLNPKAWLASAAGIATYAQGKDELLIFAAIYGPVCWLSLAVWVISGVYFRRWLQQPSWLQAFNRGLSVLLLFSVCWSLL